MAQYDVHALGDGTLVLDCQADVLAALDTRFVVPLLPLGVVQRIDRLNPVLCVHGEEYVLMSQGAATVPKGELKTNVAMCRDDRYAILNALDVLITGS